MNIFGEIDLYFSVMEKRNKVFIARSLDGYIADKNGGIDWLHSIPNPDHLDMGYEQFMEQVDAIVMGRITFETVCSFDIDWPYDCPVFVWSRSLDTLPDAYKGKVEIVKGSVSEILSAIHEKGFKQLYIDGGATIRSFLQQDLLDEMILTTIPVLLGGGSPLFTDCNQELDFAHIKTEVFLGEVVQTHYERKRLSQ